MSFPIAPRTLAAEQALATTDDGRPSRDGNQLVGVVAGLAPALLSLPASPEFGTKKQQATPFLAPALEENKEAAIDAMAERLQRELDKAAKA